MVASGGVYQWWEGEKIGTQGAEFEHDSNHLTATTFFFTLHMTQMYSDVVFSNALHVAC